MSITYELREFMNGADGYELWCPHHKKELLRIADRIDAEHEAKVAYWQEASYKDGYDEGFASADDWLAQHEDAMAEHGWARLPRDADGVPIRVGEVVDVMLTDKFTGHKNVVVTSVIFKRSAVLVTVDTDDGPFTFMPKRICHHHAPTVEDVLREFVDQYAFYSAIEGDIHPDMNAQEEVLRQFAAKLRLRGDAE